jgi:hydrophobe/amphiphile efflux-3 (HAE3) family protein
VQLADAAARAPGRTLAAIGALSLASAFLALSLRPSVAQDTLIASSSSDYRATQAAARTFGEAPVVVLVREPLRQLLAPGDLTAVSRLEACIGGQTLAVAAGGGVLEPQPGAKPYGGPNSPCAYLMRSRPVLVVYGPGTFLNRAVAALDAQLAAIRAADRLSVRRVARAAYRLALARHLTPALAQAAALAAAAALAQRLTAPFAGPALSSGLVAAPAITDTPFIDHLVFARAGGESVRPRLASLFPAPDAALIQARLRGGLTSAQVARTISAIRAAVAMPEFRLTSPDPYTVTGEPVVLSDLATRFTGQVSTLLGGAVVAMALALTFFFGGALRLLPLGIALSSAAIAFGAFALAGSRLTLASLAALPILIGLAVDYAIQFQSRAREPAGAEPRAAVAHAAARGAPAIAAAALATGAGFVVLWLSPVPMLRGFGALIVIGIGVAVLVTLTACPAVLALAGSDLGVFGASLRGAREILAEHYAGRLRARRPARRQARQTTGRGEPRLAVASASRAASAAAMVSRHPAAVLAIAGALAVVGWVADTAVSVQTDITKLVGGGAPALRDLAKLERVTGASGEIDVIVRSGNVATPRTLEWMEAYERVLEARFGRSGARGCAGATLCPALSLPDLFTNGGGRLDAVARTSRSIDRSLHTLPPYFTRSLISDDRRAAVLAFGIRLMPLARQERVIAYMRARLNPPGGVPAELAGLPVLAADTAASLSSPARRLETSLAALLAVALALLAALRDLRRALVPLIPIALASGWSALLLFALPVQLDPMSASLGALVIAITTEFSVLLAERYRQERAAGLEPALALRTAYTLTGAAVLASAATVIVGFGVLLLSDIAMLRSFGFVTVIDLSVSLAGVMLVLPAALALAERPVRARVVV